MDSIIEIRKDAEKLNRFFEKNKKLVYMIIHKNFKNTLRSSDYEDIVQCGMIGLFNAIKKFNPDYGYTFSTYATANIDGEIRRYQREYRSHIIHVSRRPVTLFYKYLKIKGRGFSDENICKKLGIDKRELDFILKTMQKPAYFGEILHRSKNGINITVEDVIGGYSDVENDVVKKIDLEEKIAALKTILNERECGILNLYVKGDRQVQIAKKLGISQAQVSRRLKNIKRKAKAIDK